MDSIRKWLNKPKADDKSLLARFYHADRGLTAVANELDSFDGRSEPERCSRLVSKLRQEQDRVLGIINQIMDELLGDDRACRAFRAKFPEEVLQESLAGQLWFGAECLSAGSAILNREVESAEMRPLAKAVTKSLDNVRNLLRDQCLRNNTPNSPHLKLDLHDQSTELLYESLKIFDRLFAEFELLYVSAMVTVKTKQEHEIQEMICVLFSETLQRALKLGILEQEQVDSYDPSLMFSIPRLAIISGLVIFTKGPLNMDQGHEHLSEMFRPFRKLLIKMRDYLRTLNENELFQLEKLLCTNEEINLSEEPPKTLTNVKVEKFYRKQEWVSEEGPEEEEIEEEYESTESTLVNADCATGYLVPNTNLGHLLQSNVAPLTRDIVESTEGGDSGTGTGEDRSPEGENTRQYDENWENLRKNLPGSSKSPSSSHHHRHKERSARKKSRKHLTAASSSDDSSTSSSASSSASSSPTSSASGDAKDVARRMKFKSTENLLHRLFVCIAGVADQLQTNFAADLRQILRSVFLMNCSQEEEEKPAIIDETKTKDNQDLFEFRASEENVIRQSNSNQGSIGSQQSICSAEEVNVESDGSEGAVFEEDEEVEDSELDQSRTARYGNRLTGRSISLSDDATSSTAEHNYSISPSTSHPQSPPKWLPDHVVPKCMACESQFTAFRRRHHCRNCGGIFCSQCSSTQTPLPKFGLTKPVRVCRDCYAHVCEECT